MKGLDNVGSVILPIIIYSCTRTCMKTKKIALLWMEEMRKEIR
jgi:hypothetical protein